MFLRKFVVSYSIVMLLALMLVSATKVFDGKEQTIVEKHPYYAMTVVLPHPEVGTVDCKKLLPEDGIVKIVTKIPTEVMHSDNQTVKDVEIQAGESAGMVFCVLGMSKTDWLLTLQGPHDDSNESYLLPPGLTI